MFVSEHMTALPVFVVGSSSFGRLSVLRDFLGSRFRLVSVPPDIDEKAIRDDSPERLTELISAAKLDAVLAKAPREVLDSAQFVLTSDQVAVFEGEIREKPVDAAQNYAFLVDYRNRSIATVATTFLLHVPSGRRASAVHHTRTHFGDIPDAVIERLIARGSSLQSAGGFVVEDEDLSKCVRAVEGGIEGVRGVHPPQVEELMQRLSETHA